MKRKNVKCKYCKKINDKGESYCNFGCRMNKYISKKENGCWEWIGMKDKNGYGQFCDKNLKFIFSHRESFKYHNGYLDKEKCVCHSCDNPCCVNPDHLWLGTQKENHKDMHKKGRQGYGAAKGEKNHLSILKEEEVKEIREIYENGKSQKEIANIFGVTQGTISSILRKATWKHIE